MNRFIRCAIFTALAIVFVYMSQDVYFQLGYGGLECEIALAKYVLHIDRSGGPLEENIENYLDDRWGSILVAASLMALALVFAVKACNCLRRATSKPQEASAAKGETSGWK
jgi:hypothetical protein